MDFCDRFFEQCPPVRLQACVCRGLSLSLFWGEQGLDWRKGETTLFDKGLNTSLETLNEWQAQGTVWGIRLVRKGCAPKVEKTIKRDRVSRGVTFYNASHLPVSMNCRPDEEAR